jgi:photosystem I P700 chlorophyll a apoprotein A2
LLSIRPALAAWPLPLSSSRPPRPCQPPTAGQETRPTAAQIVADPARLTVDLGPEGRSFEGPGARVTVRRVPYWPSGVLLDISAKRAGETVTGGIIWLNYGNHGRLRDDRGNRYPAQEGADATAQQIKSNFDTVEGLWAVPGFLSPESTRFTLELNISALGLDEYRAEIPDLPVPDGFAEALGTDLRDEIVGYTVFLRSPRVGTSPSGTMSVRVHAVSFLADAIAVDLAAINGYQHHADLNSSNWSMRLVDDQGRVYPIIQNRDSNLRSLDVGNDEVLEGRVFFVPQVVAPDAKTLTLVTNSNNLDMYGTADDNPVAPVVQVPLGPLPTELVSGSTLADFADRNELNMAQPPLRLRPVAISAVDHIQQLREELGARETEEGLVIDLPGDVLFNFDDDTLRPDAAAVVARLGELLRSMDRPAAINGHTDNRGSETYNQSLSERRAAAVRRALVETHDVPAARLTVTGYDETRPVAPNARPDGSDDPEGRQRNRRVEVIIEQ